MPALRRALPTKTVRGLSSASWRTGEMLTKVVANYGIVTKLTGLPAFGGVLEGFPLVHEVTDLPHEPMVLRHNCICKFPIVIETGGRHLAFECLDGLFPLGNTAFQLTYPAVALVVHPSLSAGFGVSLLLLFIGCLPSSRPRRLGRRLWSSLPAGRSSCLLPSIGGRRRRSRRLGGAFGSAPQELLVGSGVDLD